MLSYSGGLSSQQQKTERKRKSQAVHQLYEEDFKKTIRSLNAAIKNAQGKVKDELHALRVKCLEEREAMSAEAEAEFEEALARLRRGRDDLAKLKRAEQKDKIDAIKREIAALRARIVEERRAWPEIWRGYQIAEREKFERFVREARAARDARVREAREQCIARGTSALRDAQNALLQLNADKSGRQSDRRFSKQYEASKRKEPKKVTAAQKAKERKQESDDEVRSNLDAIDPRLVTMFDLYKNKVKETDRKSRTEAFLEMYQEDQGNMDAALWQAEEEATNRFLEQQYREKQAAEKERERKERKQKQKHAQATFGTASGADLAGDPRQLIIGEPPPKARRGKIPVVDPFLTGDTPF